MDSSLRSALLRFVMQADAVVLTALGLALMLIPDKVLNLFHFPELPVGAMYIMGMWGAILAAMGIGYYLAAGRPVQNIVMVQLGIVRAGLETLLTLGFLFQAKITFQQAATGIFLPLWFAIAYLILYPRSESPATAAKAQGA